MNKLGKYFLPILLFVIVLVFSLYAFDRNLNHIRKRRAQVFDVRVDQAVKEVKSRMNDYEQLLKAARSLIYVKDTVTKKDWREFVGNLEVRKNYPGIQGLGYAIVSDSIGIQKLYSRMKRTGYKDYEVFPNTKRDLYSAIIYIEPFTGRNLRAFGYDMLTNPVRKKAMETARDSNRAVLSGKVLLKQETRSNTQPGFLLFLPIYKNKRLPETVDQRRKLIEGFTYIPFRAVDLMGHLLRDYSDLKISIYDRSDKIRESLLFSSKENAEAKLPSSEFMKDTTVSIEGINWTMSFETTANFGSDYEKKQPYLILFSGVIISVLLLILSLLELQRRDQTLKELEFAKGLDKKKEEFIGIASHELKTPLTSLKAYIQLLQRTPIHEDPVRANTYINKAADYLEKLQELISDLLDVSKIAAGKLTMTKEDIDFDDFVKNVIESFKPTTHTHQIMLLGHTHALIRGDRNRIEQMIINLLTNAIKYSPGQDRIEVRLGKREKQVLISVRDYGIGIPVEKQQKIFDRFYRVESESHKFQGLGIGLYITCEMVKNHEGKIWVNSDAGKGSEFFISLPVVGTRTKSEKEAKSVA